MNWLINIEQNEVLKALPKTATSKEMITRKMAAIAREKEQEKLFDAEKIFKASVHAKLIIAGAREYCEAHQKKWFDNFSKCEEEKYVQVCEICRKVRELKYRCCLKWCPCCNWRVSLKRRELMERMTAGIYDVKHLVLTQRNFTEGLRAAIRQSRKNQSALRRRKFMGKISGGAASLEFTKEKIGSWKNGVKLAGGWHLHWHILIQASFLPMSKISAAWAEYVGQKFAICKYKDVDELSYLQEVCKYVVKGADISKWTPAEILEFVIALDGTRCFSTFGKFRELQKFAAALIECDRVSVVPCECGSDSFFFGKDREAALAGVKKWQSNFDVEK
jgi:replication protein